MIIKNFFLNEKYHIPSEEINDILEQNIGFNPTGDLDFKNNRKEAREWGNKEFGDLSKHFLTDQEKSVLSDYSQFESRYVNQYLIATKGKTINSHEKDNYKIPAYILKKFKIEDLNEKIKLLDAAIQKKILKKTMYVYRWVSEKQFGMELDDLEDFNDQTNQQMINQENFKKIKSEFEGKEFPHYNYISTSLIKNPIESSHNQNYHPILMRIKVPKGQKALYLGHISEFSGSEHELLINRNCIIKYERFFITTLENKQIVEVEISIISNDS